MSFLSGRSVTQALKAQAEEPGGDHFVFLPNISLGVRSHLYAVRNIPVPDFSTSNYHPGVESLLSLMGQHGLKFYQHDTEDALSGPQGLIAKDDVVLIKINGQWEYRGCTNSDVLRGLIQRVLNHPGDFEGEIVLIENGQGRGTLNTDHANAEDPSHNFQYLIEDVFQGQPVSGYLLDLINGRVIEEDNHTTDGYRRLNPHPAQQSWAISYPCFTTAGGHRVEVAKGLWTGSGYSQKLKLINVPVLKTHSGCGVTGALKLFYGVLSMRFSDEGYHYSRIGQVLGEMFAHVKAPDLNIMDAIWVSHKALGGYPVSSTSRQNTLMAGIDPVALDYWASKYVLYPIDQNPNHHPDFPEQYTDSNLSQYLSAAAEEINSCTLIGGAKVTREEGHIVCHQISMP